MVNTINEFQERNKQLLEEKNAILEKGNIELKEELENNKLLVEK